MMTIPLRRSMLPLSLGLLAALALALLLAIGWMGAPRQDVIDLLRYLAFSGLISLGASALAVGWLRRGRGRLWQQVTIAYSVGIGIALFNILLTARLMFISADHDLALLTLLLLVAAVISLALGYTLAQTLAQRVVTIGQGARAISSGDLSARVPYEGADELSALALEFNRMAEQLAYADAERRRLEAARRDLIAAISHDLRTPLASVRAMVEALADGVVDDQATVQRYLTTMRGQIGHLSALIDDLFELSQIDAGALRLDRQRVAADDLVSDAIDALRVQALARGVALQGDPVPGGGHVICASQKIERVLYNLISNAIRHTPAGGTIAVRSYATTSDQLEGAERGRPYTPVVVFEVIDTGEGIAAEDLPFVFERFFRGERSRSRATGGAGLGLAIARGIVEAHGGHIWIESKAGHGTRVRFALPGPKDEG